MADAIFDKDGKITNLADLTAQEVADAYQVKNKEIHDARVAESERARIAKDEAEQAKKDLTAEREKNAKPPVEKKPDAEIAALAERVADSELRSTGLDAEEVEKVKKIAKGEEITVAEALTNDVFVAWQAKHREDVRKAKAKLGASNGSGSSFGDDGEPMVKPGTSFKDEQEAKTAHQEAWKKAKANL